MAGNLQSTFTNLKRLGAGAFGEVYRGQEKSSGKMFALKILPWDRSAVDEMKAYYGFPDHPNIVKYHRHIRLRRNRICLVMEYCGGGNLNDYLLMQEPDPSKMLRFMREIASAVAFLHRYRIVHRDLKPDNILITYEGTLKVADFGIAKIVSVSQAGGSLYNYYLNSAQGHLFFCAPEVQDGRSTEKTDVFQMGAIFACILERNVIVMNGARFVAISVEDRRGVQIGLGQALHDGLLPRYTLNASLQINRDLRTWVERMLQRNHRDRPTAREVDDAMQHLQSTEERRGRLSYVGDAITGALTAIVRLLGCSR